MVWTSRICTEPPDNEKGKERRKEQQSCCCLFFKRSKLEKMMNSIIIGKTFSPSAKKDAQKGGGKAALLLHRSGRRMGHSSTVWLGVSFPSPSCCGQSGHVCRVKQASLSRISGSTDQNFFVAPSCSLFRMPASLVITRHVLQPSVKLVTAKAPAVCFSNKPMACLAITVATKLFSLGFPSSHISAASCNRLCSPYRASASA